MKISNELRYIISQQNKGLKDDDYLLIGIQDQNEKYKKLVNFAKSCLNHSCCLCNCECCIVCDAQKLLREIGEI